MLAWIKANRNLAAAIAFWFIAATYTIWGLKSLAATGKEGDAWVMFGLSVFGLFYGVMLIAHMLYRCEAINSESMELWSNRISDEVRNLRELRKQIADDLDTSGQCIDHTMLGAFLYGRDSIINDSSIACTTQIKDWDDREFDSIFVVKRKSTPVDEVLQAIYQTGKT